MLAIGRGLVAKPRIVLLNEPFIGLAPLVVEELIRVIGDLNANGLSIFLVEQNARLVTMVARKGYVPEAGRVVLEGDPKALMNEGLVQQAFLGG
ncbi:MAG: ABC transporter ATP-binding protein [Syntrophorhabdales bacterium]|jgi:branched-chain amino acid transport system ATP-binding protein